ncbi:MAG: hypothetical protein P4L69_15225 [Desulfosporosinus sp.]|nr:hypothetical protein [Desulfosporosinus sp.]
MVLKEERNPARVRELLLDSSLPLTSCLGHRFQPAEISAWYINPFLMLGSSIFNPVVLNLTGKGMMHLIILNEYGKRLERWET